MERETKDNKMALQSDIQILKGILNSMMTRKRESVFKQLYMNKPFPDYNTRDIDESIELIASVVYDDINRQYFNTKNSDMKDFSYRCKAAPELIRDALFRKDSVVRLAISELTDPVDISFNPKQIKNNIKTKSINYNMISILERLMMIEYKTSIDYTTLVNTFSVRLRDQYEKKIKAIKEILGEDDLMVKNNNPEKQKKRAIDL